MDLKQIEELVEQLKAQGKSEEEIMEIYYETFKEGKMDRKDLETLANHLGYELTDDFKEDETPDPIVSEEMKDISKEDLEDAKTIDKGETKEEFKEKIEETKDDEIDEEKEREEAFKLFRL